MSLKEVSHEKSEDLLFKLPKSKGLSASSELALYQGFWCPPNVFSSVLSFQSKFQSHDHDIFVASLPKSGTTWLKAIAFSVLNRRRYSLSETPLLTANPHQLAPVVELADSDFDVTHGSADPLADEPITAAGGKLWSTHLPYGSLAESVRQSPCRILYVCRNPLDVVVSAWHFWIRRCEAKWTLEEYVDRFCEGEAHVFGPYWCHVLGYWKQSLERPEKVLFLKYEEMREDAVSQVKRIAEFVGFPFSDEEVTRGVVEEIVELCSLKSLKNLEVNKTGELFPTVENKIFFRKGEVGDWVNHLTPTMARRINDAVEEHLSGSGLTFKLPI